MLDKLHSGMSYSAVGMSSMLMNQHCTVNERLYFYFLNLFLFIYFWRHWVFVAACGLSLVAVSGGYSSLQCIGFSCCGARALGARA